MAHAPDPARRLGALLRLPASRALAVAADGVPCHLVGGALRDRLLDRPHRDLDAVVERAGESIAQRLAAALEARAIRLGGDRFAAWRVVRSGLTVDLWDRDGQPLAADLERRDLTIHAIAVALADGAVSDPFDGIGDLSRRRLRATAPTSFSADPLRVLRLARFAAELAGFTVDAATLAAARAAAPALPGVAAERIRDELRRSLEAPDARPAVALWARLGIEALPTPTDGEERLARLDRWLAQVRPDERFAARWAALLLGAEPAAAGGLRARGWLSGRDAAAIAALLPPPPPPDDERARRRFLHAAGRRWRPAAALAALAAGRDGDGFAALAGALAATARDGGEAIFEPPTLLDGHEVAEITGLPAGRELGGVLAVLRSAQVDGAVRTRAEAVRLVRELRRCS